MKELAEKMFRFAAILALFEGNVIELAHLLEGLRSIAGAVVDGLEMRVPLGEPLHQEEPALCKLAPGIYAAAEEVVEGNNHFLRIRIRFDDDEIERALRKKHSALVLVKDFAAFKKPFHVLWLIINLDEVMERLEKMADELPKFKTVEDVEAVLRDFAGTLAMLRECVKS
ncbi:hypothetical protein DRP77_06595 [Candidatus Poribacteria bacterium]|nr:MAG: hypothetical protein DRP77_06595 [Candidatus Poribacteria bacterium]